MDELRQKILDELTQKRNCKYYKNTGWVETKCPSCDKKRDNKRHLNIQLIDGRPIIGTCFRASCNVGGILNKQFGKSLGLSDELCTLLEEESIKYHKYSTVTKYYVNNIRDDFILGDIDPDVGEYFLKRTGKNLIEYQSVFRICTSMKKFLKVNKLKIPQAYPLIRWEEEGRKFIYFFNSTYSVVNYREIYGENLKGKLTLVRGNTKENLKHKPYFVDNNKNEYNEDFDTLIIAEGPFDIVNTYLHLFSGHNALFLSVTGAASLKSIIFEYTKYHYRARIHIISDKDIDISWYKRFLYNKIKDRVSEFIVYYNKLSKDVGDISDGFDMEKITLIEFNKEQEYNNLE